MQWTSHTHAPRSPAQSGISIPQTLPHNRAHLAPVPHAHVCTPYTYACVMHVACGCRAAYLRPLPLSISCGVGDERGLQQARQQHAHAPDSSGLSATARMRHARRLHHSTRRVLAR